MRARVRERASLFRSPGRRLTGVMITTPHRCGCGGKSCLSNNLPLVHFEFWLQPTTLILFLSQNFLFWLHLSVRSVSWGRSVAPRLGRNLCWRVRPHTCTFTDNLVAIVWFSLYEYMWFTAEKLAGLIQRLEELSELLSLIPARTDVVVWGWCLSFSIKPLLGEHLEWRLVCFTFNCSSLIPFLLKWFPLLLFCCVWFLPLNKSCFLSFPLLYFNPFYSFCVPLFCVFTFVL